MNATSYLNLGMIHFPGLKGSQKSEMKFPSHILLSARALLSLLVLLLPSSMKAESAEDIGAAYETARRTGFIKVHEDYLEKLRDVQKMLLTSQQLEAANAIQPEIEQVGIRLALYKKGENPAVPGVIPAEEVSQTGEKESTNAATLKESAGLHREFIDRLRKGLVAINEHYFQRASEAQKGRLAAADLAGANALESLKSTLKAEIDAIAGKQAKPGAELATKPGKGDALLNEEFRKRWSEVSGTWEFKGDSLVGSGNSQINYTAKIRAPFTLSFDFEVRKGKRIRVYLGKELKIANEGYQNQIGLYPLVGKEEPVPYEINKKYSVRFVANRRFLEMYLDDKLITKRDSGIGDEIESISFLAGDSFSPGETEFSNIRLE